MCELMKNMKVLSLQYDDSLDLQKEERMGPDHDIPKELQVMESIEILGLIKFRVLVSRPERNSELISNPSFTLELKKWPKFR